MSMQEPGLERHEWESRLAALEDDLRDSPAETLPLLADLVQELLEESGYDLDEPATLAGEERDVVAEYLAARETADRIERGDAVDPAEIGAAVEGLRAVTETLLRTRVGGGCRDTAIAVCCNRTKRFKLDENPWTAADPSTAQRELGEISTRERRIGAQAPRNVE